VTADRSRLRAASIIATDLPWTRSQRPTYRLRLELTHHVDGLEIRPPTLEGDPKGDGAAVNAPPVLVGQRAAFVGCHARISEVLTKTPPVGGGIFATVAQKMLMDEEGLLTSSRRPREHPIACCRRRASWGLKAGGRGTRRPTADYGVGRVTIPLPALTRVSTLPLMPRLVGGAFFLAAGFIADRR
jgi:hypothetical protein